MISQAKVSKSSGFTIIEVMIVLAIAGLILGMVLIAIPTLERNSRNNQRKQDVATVLAAISRYGLNNSGEFPAAGTESVVLSSAFKLYYYSDSGQVEFAPQTNTTATDHLGTNDIDKVTVYNYAKCESDNSGKAIAKGAGYDNVVVLFTIESGNSNTANRCQQL